MTLHWCLSMFCDSDNRYERIQYECIRCLKAIMNNTVGIKEMLAHHEALTIVARSLEPTKPSVMSEAVKLLGAVCLISSDSHKKVLDAITMNGEFKGRERFLPIVQGLMNKKNENLRVRFFSSCLFRLIFETLSLPSLFSSFLVLVWFVIRWHALSIGGVPSTYQFHHFFGRRTRL